MSDIEGISEGRRKVALEKAEEARREWLRAERAEAEVATLRAEVERLTGCLSRANANHEKFEREWYLRGDELTTLRAEVERLRTEVQTWQSHAKTAIWSDSEECKLLTADNERLRAALHYIAWKQREDDKPHLIARAALVEAVAQAISNAWDSEQRIFEAEEAAIDLIRAEALEEAAREAEHHDHVGALIAAAIRALKEEA